jgi:N utilization substance protein B
MATRRLERHARARALQVLYAADMRDDAKIESIANNLFDDLAVAPAERKLAEALIRTVVQRGDALDEALAKVTANWRLDRIGAIERSLLRLGAAELVRGETPPRVVLQEAVHLAERFGGLDSARFVNGILDALARDLGRL